MKRICGRLCVATVFCIVAIASTGNCFWLDDIGYTALRSTVGSSSISTGDSVTICQAEGGSQPTQYAPVDTGDEYTLDYSSSPYNGVTFHWDSGYPRSRFYHADYVGQFYYGDYSDAGSKYSMTYGVQSVHCFNADDWLSGIVNYGLYGTPAPVITGCKVHNNSWVGTSDVTSNQTYLLGLDRAIARDDLIVVNAVNNYYYNSVEANPLVDASYNCIAVGLDPYWDSGSSDYQYGSAYGPTGSDYGDFQKPDIVCTADMPANRYYTSYAAPVVASAAALLVDAANDLGIADGDNALVVKSVMMAGAQKHPIWHKGEETLDDDATHPLDDYLGAGKLRVDWAYEILTRGEQSASDSDVLLPMGWSLETVDVDDTKMYVFDAVTGQQVSAILAWLRQDDASGTIRDLNLRLYEAIYSAGTYVLGSLLQESVATTGNVEHIYFDIASDGTYALVVEGPGTGSGAEEYAMAWMVPEPASLLLFGCGLAVSVLLRRKSRP